MSDARWEQIKAVFHAALAAPAQDRAAILHQKCGGDGDLRREVESLLDARTRSLVRTAGAAHAMADATAAGAPREQAGEQIGRYRLLESIGEGGFGSVWMAEQREPVKRRVALKIIKLGMDTRQVIMRFEAERQALAMMDHPYIARVFDAGATETGRPYFVMEYIKGVPILGYCTASRLDTRARLELFSGVCHAIQHAHMKGIIHRDIKPSNVLVTMHDGVPVPKVIDFGIAKATNTELTTRTLFTEHRQMIGTPAYMSPEQAEMSGLDIDTRSDIYSLGVLLYELLTGTTPFDTKSLLEAGFAEMLRIIREVEPHKPSTRLSSLGESGPGTAEQRHAGDTRRLELNVRGDLDWIVMKCLEKDRSRRYETANGLAADIGRHLRDEPVTAGPPGAGYRVRKFVKRHRGQVLAAGIVAGALVLGVIGTSAGMVWALDEKSKASRSAEAEAAAKIAAQANEEKAVAAAEAAEASKEEEAKARKRSETITEFVITALQSSDAKHSRRPGVGADAAYDITILAAMDNAVADIDSGRFADDPETEAELRTTIGVIFVNNGKYEEARSLLEQVLADRERDLNGDDLAVARSLHALATLYHRQGQYARAEPHFTRALAIKEKALGPDHPEVASSLANLAGIYEHQGQHAQAESLLMRAIAIDERAFGPDHLRVATNLGVLAEVYMAQDQYARAEPLLMRSLAIHENALGPDHAEVATCLSDLAVNYNGLGQFAQAEPLFTRALLIREKALGPDHPQVASSLNNLASYHFGQGQLARAEPLLARALTIWEKVLGPDHIDVATALHNLAVLYTWQGRYTDAEPLSSRALAIKEKALGPDHRDVLTCEGNLATVYWHQGRLDQSIPMFEELLGLREAAFGRQHAETLRTAANLGVNYKDAGRLAEAIPLLEEAHAAATEHPDLRFATPALLDAYTRAADPANPESIARVTRLLQESIANARGTMPEDSAELGAQLTTFGLTLLTLRAWEEAEPLLRESLAIREKAQPDSWTTFNTRSLLGEALLGQDQLAEAEPLLLDGYWGMQERDGAIPPAARVRLPEALERLVRLYEAKGDQAGAAAWRAALEAARAEQGKPAGG